MSKHAPPHGSGKSTGKESGVKPFAKYLVVYTILYTIIGCLNSEVSLKWQLKKDEENLLKLIISRKIDYIK
jgi:hypothetical protein